MRVKNLFEDAALFEKRTLFRAFTNSCTFFKQIRHKKTVLRWKTLTSKITKLARSSFFKTFYGWKLFTGKMKPRKQILQKKIVRRTQNVAIILFYAWARKAFAILERESLLKRKTFFPWIGVTQQTNSQYALKLHNFKRRKIATIFANWTIIFLNEKENEEKDTTNK